MKKAHFILQGKGGVGKSFISSLIAQFLIERGDSVSCIDTDPNNSTFSSIKAIDAAFLELFDADSKLNERNFDKLIETMLTTDDADFVIDNGATSFLPLIDYISENHVFEMLADKYEIYIHVPVTGGQGQGDTINGFVSLIEKYPSCNFVVWLNEYHGAIKDDEGNGFEGMETYKKNKKAIRGLVRIGSQNVKTFGRDIEEMTKANLTFAEVGNDARFNLMAKQRLKIFKESIFNTLPTIF